MLLCDNSLIKMHAFISIKWCHLSYATEIRSIQLHDSAVSVPSD